MYGKAKLGNFLLGNKIAGLWPALFMTSAPSKANVTSPWPWRPQSKLKILLKRLGSLHTSTVRGTQSVFESHLQFPRQPTCQNSLATYPDCTHNKHSQTQTAKLWKQGAQNYPGDKAPRSVSSLPERKTEPNRVKINTDGHKNQLL